MKIAFHSLVIGNSLDNGINCPDEVTDTLVSTISDAVVQMEPLFQEKYCQRIEVKYCFFLSFLFPIFRINFLFMFIMIYL